MAAVAASVAMPGCSDDGGLRLAPVTGQVTYQEKPLDHEQVVFSPEPGTPGPQAVGTTQADGTLRMQTAGRDGAPLGKHVVTVHCRRLPTAEQARDPYFVPEALIPEKYFRESASSAKRSTATSNAG